MVGSSYLENGTGLYSANLTFSLRVFIVKIVVGRKADYVKTTTVFTNLGECSYKFLREKTISLVGVAAVRGQDVPEDERE